QKIEDLEKDRQHLEEQNNILEMRLERHNLQQWTGRRSDSHIGEPCSATRELQVGGGL
ncbi:hypothetical protein ATANTOWER_016828, partial [Ataeniobius toweri]|nr:hypothetical protein [Ataeniobius toweri]